jgi:hypothetical protein
MLDNKRRSPDRDKGRWPLVLSNAKSPVYGNTGGNSPTVEPAVFGDKAFGPTCNGYSVTCSACRSVPVFFLMLRHRKGRRGEVNEIAR